MKIYKTHLEKEYYILTPRNVAGELTKGIQVSFPDDLEIETFKDFKEFKNRCNELGIEIEGLINN